MFSRAVRGHWSVERMHWHLDVTFREDANQTLDRLAAQNLNNIRKWCLSILKVLELFRPKLSMKKKRFMISMNPPDFSEQVLAFQNILLRPRGGSLFHAFVVSPAPGQKHLKYGEDMVEYGTWK